MIRLLARFSISILVVLCLILGTTRLIGAFTSPGLDTLQQFNCTPETCWHGIQLGVTTVPQAAAILGADQTLQLFKYRPTDAKVCWKWTDRPYEDGNIEDGCYDPASAAAYTLYFSPVDYPLRLGDVLPFMGKPITSFLCMNWHEGQILSENMAVWVVVPDNQPQLEPELTIARIAYFSPNRNPTDSPIQYRWTGLFRWAKSNPHCFG